MKIEMPKFPELENKPVTSTRPRPDFEPTARQLAYSMFDSSDPEEAAAEQYLRIQADMGE